ncbi:hypothetical protein [Nonomuraea sp. NPDC001831]|uniref:hypothetical protein n=1 Tax=Nonomuraea sp. NPDC001831 TaxID=3364340 RepID=UPI0036CC4BA7
MTSVVAALSLGVLDFAVRLELGEECRRALESELALALALPEDQAAARPLGALVRVADAVFEAEALVTVVACLDAVRLAARSMAVDLALHVARPAVPLLTAGVRIVAAVPPLLALHLVLLTGSTLASVSLSIIPLGADRTSMWPTEAFFMFDDEEVAVELVSGHLTVTRAHEIAVYSHTFIELAERAVYGKAARTLIMRAIQVVDEQPSAFP